MTPDWEHGSDFHWMDDSGATGASGNRWEGTAFGNGRQALVAALAALRPPRVWLPDYYCLDVYEAVHEAGYRARAYAHRPGLSPGRFGAGPGDCVVAVDFFGWGPPALAWADLIEGLTVLVDRTHALERVDDRPWFASLRKTLPVPDGGWLSPLPRVEPPPIRAEHLAAAGARLSAMLLKREYLEGRVAQKATFRAEAVSGEQAFSWEPSAPLGVSRMRATQGVWQSWNRARISNWEAFAAAYSGRARLVGSAGSTFIILQFADERQRAALRARLISAQCYPAVLWSLEGAQHEVSPESQLWSETMLALHCDGRYGSDDMRRVASLCSDD